MLKCTTTIALSLTIVTSSPRLVQTQYLRVTADTATIRVAARQDAQVVAQARKGDVFELNRTNGAWYEIFMFSGEYRYLPKTSAEPVARSPTLPNNQATLRSACLAYVRAQDRSGSESQRRFPSDVMRRIHLEQLLHDRYGLPVFQRYGIAPARKATLAALCARNNWIQ